jgi:hypothetical protein
MTRPQSIAAAPQSPKQPDQPAGPNDRLPLVFCDLDDFEQGLLPVLRHFIISLAHPERQTWQFAYQIAAQRWGETLGLPVAQALLALVQQTRQARHHRFECLDPLDLEDRSHISRDEQALLQMLHHMRRDETPRARAALANLTGGTMDPNVIRAGLSFAARFSAGNMAAKDRPSRPSLRLVR